MTELRTQQTLDDLAAKNELPPIDWHINNVIQLLHHLQALEFPRILVLWRLADNMSLFYSKFLNSYDKAERMQLLANIHDEGIFLSIQARSIPFQDGYESNLRAAHLRIEIEPPITFEQYQHRCIEKLKALHDFALGLGAVAKHTNAEPYGKIYKQMEQMT